MAETRAVESIERVLEQLAVMVEQHLQIEVVDPDG